MSKIRFEKPKEIIVKLRFVPVTSCSMNPSTTQLKEMHLYDVVAIEDGEYDSSEAVFISMINPNTAFSVLRADFEEIEVLEQKEEAVTSIKSL